MKSPQTDTLLIYVNIKKGGGQAQTWYYSQLKQNYFLVFHGAYFLAWPAPHMLDKGYLEPSIAAEIPILKQCTIV